MSKILNTQLTGIFNRLEKQELDIQMAAQCLIQAIGGEGHVYIKGYDDLKFYESFILQSHEKLASSLPLEDLQNFNDIDTTDRVLLFSPYYTSEVESDVLQLIDLDVDLVLICNNPKRDDFPNHRPIVYTEDYDKIIQPHPMALNYIYYDIYTQMIEMTRDLDL
ncbi:MAG: DUF2529 family protein [Staphylococcus epidermidis]|nr:DUF2529 family protein [Staphylococcus epidermidis]MDU1500110.1 DUF2529 family protein [Staphylococcus epidermidis]